MKFNESPRQIRAVNMMQTEFLHAGGIDQTAILIEVVEPRVGGGVTSGIECDGNLGSGAFCSRDQCIDEGRFAHARLSYQRAELALQIRQQRCDIRLGAELQQRITQFPVEQESSGGNARGVSEVGLVEHDQCFDSLTFGGSEATVHQFFTEAGNSGYHDDDLGDVGGDQFFAESVTAI